MIEKEEVYTMSDGKDYYVINSIMYDGNNYVAVGEVSDSGEEIVNDIMIMLNNLSSGNLEKVTDPELLLKLSIEFGNTDGTFDF